MSNYLVIYLSSYSVVWKIFHLIIYTSSVTDLFFFSVFLFRYFFNISWVIHSFIISFYYWSIYSWGLFLSLSLAFYLVNFIFWIVFSFFRTLIIDWFYRLFICLLLVLGKDLSTYHFWVLVMFLSLAFFILSISLILHYISH